MGSRLRRKGLVVLWYSLHPTAVNREAVVLADVDTESHVGVPPILQLRGGRIGQYLGFPRFRLLEGKGPGVGSRQLDNGRHELFASAGCRNRQLQQQN